MKSVLSAWRRVAPLLPPVVAPVVAPADNAPSPNSPATVTPSGHDKKKKRATMIASINAGNKERRKNYNHMSQEDVEDKRLSFAIRNVYCVSLIVCNGFLKTVVEMLPWTLLLSHYVMWIAQDNKTHNALLQCAPPRSVVCYLSRLTFPLIASFVVYSPYVNDRPRSLPRCPSRLC
jgi:hypothetical protein